jgi:hypothetical protein
MCKLLIFKIRCWTNTYFIEQELDLRSAIVKSLTATTKYLSIPSSTLVPNSLVEVCIVRMWVVIIRLLEDDNESIREKSAQVVSETEGGSSLLLMVSRALEFSFEFLTRNYGHSNLYRDFLLTCIDNANVGANEEGIGKVSGTRVLFDEEDTNAYLLYVYKISY